MQEIQQQLEAACKSNLIDHGLVRLLTQNGGDLFKPNSETHLPPIYDLIQTDQLDLAAPYLQNLTIAQISQIVWYSLSIDLDKQCKNFALLYQKLNEDLMQRINELKETAAGSANENILRQLFLCLASLGAILTLNNKSEDSDSREATAKEYLERALAVSNRLIGDKDDDTLRNFALSNVCLGYKVESQTVTTRAAIPNYQEAISHVERIRVKTNHDYTFLAKYYTRLANIIISEEVEMHENLEIIYFQNAITYLDKIEPKTDEVYQQLSYIYSSLALLDNTKTPQQSIDCYLLAIALTQKIESKTDVHYRNLARYNYMISELYNANSPIQAINYYVKAIEEHEKVKSKTDEDYRLLAKYNFYLGSLYFDKTQQKQKGIDCHLKSISNSEKVASKTDRDYKVLAHYSKNLGILYYNAYRSDSLEKAMSFFCYSIKAIRMVRNKDTIALPLQQRVISLLAQARFRYYSTKDGIEKSAFVPNLIASCNELLSIIYECSIKTGDPLSSIIDSELKLLINIQTALNAYWDFPMNNLGKSFCTLLNTVSDVQLATPAIRTLLPLNPQLFHENLCRFVHSILNPAEQSFIQLTLNLIKALIAIYNKTGYPNQALGTFYRNSPNKVDELQQLVISLEERHLSLTSLMESSTSLQHSIVQKVTGTNRTVEELLRRIDALETEVATLKQASSDTLGKHERSEPEGTGANPQKRLRDEVDHTRSPLVSGSMFPPAPEATTTTTTISQPTSGSRPG